MKKQTRINTAEQTSMIKDLKKKTDINSQRLLQLLSLKNLAKTNNNPVKTICETIFDIPRYKDFELIEIPEIVSASKTFDLYNFPKDHPARTKSDTYYVDDNNILRTHTTIMWDYYLNVAH